MAAIPLLILLPTEIIAMILCHLRDHQKVMLLRSLPSLYVPYIGQHIFKLKYITVEQLDWHGNLPTISKILTMFPNVRNLCSDENATIEEFTQIISRSPTRLALNVNVDDDDVEHLVDLLAELPCIEKMNITLNYLTRKQRQIMVSPEWIHIPLTKGCFRQYQKLRKFSGSGVIVSDGPISDNAVYDAFYSLYSSPIKELGFTFGVNPELFALALIINSRSSHSIKRIVLKTYCYPPPPSYWLTHLKHPIESVVDLGKCGVAPFDVPLVRRVFPNVTVIPISQKCNGYYSDAVSLSWSNDVKSLPMLYPGVSFKVW